jgi:3-oxoacyl-[acyl-carrier protein] reductase
LPTAERPLEGRVAVVTGASRGIGRAAAEAFGAAGAHVVVGYRSGAEEAAAVAEAIGDARAVRVDVAEPAEVEALFAGLDRVDVLFANAGIYPVGPLESASVEEWDRVFDVNARGTFLCCRAALPKLRAAGGGRIVTIASNTIERAPRGTGVYAASKAAIVALTRVLAREVAADGITANCVVPSLVETEAAVATFAAALDLTVAAQAIQRRQQPEDLVGALLFLASDASAFVTGQTINVDGGLYFR